MELGAEVTYECDPGNFFRHNKTQSNFTVRCNEDGNFERPNPWPVCQSEVRMEYISIIYLTEVAFLIR